MRGIVLAVLLMLLWGLIFAVVDAWCVPVNMVGVSSNYQQTGVQGSIALSRQLQEKVHRVAVKRLASRGVPVELGWFKAVSDPFPGFRVTNYLEVIYDEFSSWYFRANDKRYIANRSIAHILAPPFIVNGKRFIGGVALQNSCRTGGFSYSNATPVNSSGVNRIPHSINEAMHEILHALGAEHDQSKPNVMDENASLALDKLIIAGEARQLPILPETLKQLKRC